MPRKNFKTKKGMALAEILIGASIMSMAILAAVSAYSTYIKYAFANQKNIQASYVLEEGMEVMIFLRDTSWSNISQLSTTTTYYLTFSGSSWATSTTPQYVDGQFLRSITLADVRRDADDKITVSGTLDTGTKKITTTVSYWQGHSTTTKTISTYLTNI